MSNPPKPGIMRMDNMAFMDDDVLKYDDVLKEKRAARDVGIITGFLGIIIGPADDDQLNLLKNILKAFCQADIEEDKREDEHIRDTGHSLLYTCKGDRIKCQRMQRTKGVSS